MSELRRQVEEFSSAPAPEGIRAATVRPPSPAAPPSCAAARATPLSPSLFPSFPLRSLRELGRKASGARRANGRSHSVLKMISGRRPHGRSCGHETHPTGLGASRGRRAVETCLQDYKCTGGAYTVFVPAAGTAPRTPTTASCLAANANSPSTRTLMFRARSLPERTAQVQRRGEGRALGVGVSPARA
ncbi:hypothetical protein OH77DRAFT_676835 [Trametes cingulata]|nr:hypothetical protein OH77DRAFT_676835 [Trametes cingulata]